MRKILILGAVLLILAGALFVASEQPQPLPRGKSRVAGRAGLVRARTHRWRSTKSAFRSAADSARASLRSRSEKTRSSGRERSCAPIASTQ